MELRTWFRSGRGRIAALAEFLTSRSPRPISYEQVHAWGCPPDSYYLRPVPLRHAAAVEEFTKGEVMRWDVCPEWREVWPELRAHPDAPAPEETAVA